MLESLNGQWDQLDHLEDRVKHQSICPVLKTKEASNVEQQCESFEDAVTSSLFFCKKLKREAELNMFWIVCTIGLS